MDIKRTINGVEKTITLTDAEIEKAFRERDAYYKDLDIKSKLLEMITDEEEFDYYDIYNLELPEESESTTEYSRALRKLWNEYPSDFADEFIDCLGSSDSYWESYWLVARYIIEDRIRDYYGYDI